MRIEKDHLVKILECDVFVRKFSDFATHVLQACRLIPLASKPRLIDSHGAWKNDLSRVGTHEPNLEDGLDHFKQCGHLAFWLRRMSPIVEAHDTTKNMSDAEGYPLSINEIEFRKLLLGYANEYLAFDYAYQICKYYEIGKEGGSDRAQNLAPSREYYWTACQFMKYKNVSPHALHLILKSLFLPS
jgi:hypothetical protein